MSFVLIGLAVTIALLGAAGTAVIVRAGVVASGTPGGALRVLEILMWALCVIVRRRASANRFPTLTNTSREIISRVEWESGTQPWIRHQPNEAKVLCYFCGAETATVSGYDRSSDKGRVQLYCTNKDCDVRAVEVLVTKDGHRARVRRDVQALEAIDTPPERVIRQAQGKSAATFAELDYFYSDDDPVPRRLGLDEA